MECPHIDDIKEIKKDVKTLLAHMHEQNGAAKHDKVRDDKLLVKVAILTVAIPSIIGIITVYISKGAS